LDEVFFLSVGSTSRRPSEEVRFKKLHGRRV
jgi:hypothetical protein